MDFQAWASALAAIGVAGYQTYLQKRSVALQEKAMRGETLAVDEIKKAEGFLKRNRHIFITLLLMASCWVPYFLIPKCPPDIFLAWGKTNGRIYAVVKTTEIVGDKPDRLMLLARIGDPSVAYETDKQTVRSATFEIRQMTTAMEIALTQESVSNLIANRQGAVEVYVLEVPKDFPFENVRSLAEAQKLGAKLMGSKSFAF